MLITNRGNNYIRKTRRWVLVFLFLFISATVATAFHHHADGSEHHDCPICVAGHRDSSVSVTVFSLTNQQPVSSNEIPKVVLLYNSIRVALLPCRAPPA